MSSLRKVMGEERAYDEVEGAARSEGKYVGGDPLDATGCQAGFGGDGDGVRIAVEAGEFDSDAMGVCPSLDFAEAVAIAAANIKNADGLIEVGENRRLRAEPVEQGAIGERNGVGPGQIAEAGAHFFAAAGLIH